jgi:hypothetical protein
MRRGLFAALILTLLACMVCWQADATPDYRVTDDHISMEVLSDGSALVTEEISYHFDSSYNGISASLDASGTDGIEDIRLYVDGIRQLRQVDGMATQPLSFTVARDGDVWNIRACAPGRGGDRFFRYKYRMKGLARRYLDAGRIDRRFIGAGNQVPMEDVRVTLALPGSGQPVYSFVCGAMGAKDMALSSTGALTLGPAAVPPGEFVEADVLFPAGWLKDAPVIREGALKDALH